MEILTFVSLAMESKCEAQKYATLHFYPIRLDNNAISCISHQVWRDRRLYYIVIPIKRKLVEIEMLMGVT